MITRREANSGLLASVFRGAVDYKKLDRLLQLRADEFVTFAQTVGYAPG